MAKKPTPEYLAVIHIAKEAGVYAFDLMARSKEIYEKYNGPYDHSSTSPERVKQITNNAKAVIRCQQNPLNPTEVAMTAFELNNPTAFANMLKVKAWKNEL